MMKNIRYYVPGGLLIGAALLILAVPEILLAVLVAFILLIGLLALYIGHRARQADAEMKGPEGDYDPRWPFFRGPMGRRWYRDF
jgi:hypothetical protein